MEDDKLKTVRQPLVTANGIILGFTLNFAANWIPRGFSGSKYLEYLIALSLCIHIPISIIVLYRILNLNYPRDRADAYFKKTLILFITGISLYFLIIVFAMIDSTINGRI